jgi:predicted RNA binding protein YcfA (HicA-like mRNA interferase family)
MKLPRDISGQDLVKVLKVLGYEVSHQRGSHIRLTTQQQGEHHLTIPAHNPLKVGTLNAILRDIGNHFKLNRDELLNQLFAK